MNVSILFATSKKQDLPQNRMYVPIQTDAARLRANGDEIFATGDDMGVGISEKYGVYGDLTVLYFGRYNLSEDFLGFTCKKKLFGRSRCYKDDAKDNSKRVMSDAEAKSLLSQYHMILPRKSHFIVTNMYGWFSRFYSSSWIEMTQSVIERRCPQYSTHFQKTLSQNYGYMNNSFIMTRDLYIRYCDWLFPILAELEGGFDTNAALVKGVFVKLADVLFNCWLDYFNEHEGARWVEVPMVGNDKINLAKKLDDFFCYIFLGEKNNQESVDV